MECLLIGGNKTVGKSETIYNLATRLSTSGFRTVAGSLPPTFKDFKVVLEGKNNLGKEIRIIINSPTDTKVLIDEFKAFFDANGTYDILISSVRDDSYDVRKDFFKTMNISATKDFILEVPLAKIPKQGANHATRLSWYQRQRDLLIAHILNLNPFYI